MIRGDGLVQVSMKLEIRDSPGHLVAALLPISDIGGNIKTVIHEHNQENTNDFLSVEVVIEIPQERLESLINLFKEKGIRIQKIGQDRFSYQLSVIIIGHLVHTNLGDTVDQIDRTGYAEITHMNMAMPAINERSSAQFVIRSVTREDMDHALQILRTVAQEKGFLLIEPLEVM